MCGEAVHTPAYMNRPEGAPGCSLSLVTYSFEAVSLPEPGAHLFSPELEASHPPMITSPPALELWFQAFVWIPGLLPWALEFRL